MAESKYPLSLIIRAVDKVTGPLQQINSKLERSTSRLTAPFRRLGGRLSALSSAAGIPRVSEAFKGVKSKTEDLGESVGKVGKLITGMVGGALFGGYGLYALARGALDAGDSLGEMAQRVGLGVDAFAQLQFAAAQADVGPESFAKAMDKLNKELGEMKAGSGTLLSFLQKVSPTLTRQVKGAKSAEQALSVLTTAFEKVTDPSKRAALANAAFGESGLQMGQFLGQGSKKIAEQRRRFLELAGSQEALATGAGDLDNAMREAETSFLGLRTATMVALFPALTKLAQAVATFLSKHRDGLQQWALRAGAAITSWVEGGGLERLAAALESVGRTVATAVEKMGGLEGVAKIAAAALGVMMLGSVVNLVGSLGQLGIALASFGARLGALQLGTWAAGWVKYLWMMRGSIMAGLIPSLTAATASMWGFTAALLANPITWVVAAVAALGAAAFLIYKNWTPIKGFFLDFWQTIKFYVGEGVSWVWDFMKKWTVLGLIVENWEPIKSFFSDLWDGVVFSFKQAWEMIRPIVDKVSGAIDLVSSPTKLIAKGAEFVTERLGAGDALGAAQALPPAPAAAGAARVQVDFANLPRGARVTPDRGNTADLDLNMGYSMIGP